VTGNRRPRGQCINPHHSIPTISQPPSFFLPTMSIIFVPTLPSFPHQQALTSLSSQRTQDPTATWQIRGSYRRTRIWCIYHTRFPLSNYPVYPWICIWCILCILNSNPVYPSCIFSLDPIQLVVPEDVRYLPSGTHPKYTGLQPLNTLLRDTGAYTQCPLVPLQPWITNHQVYPGLS